MSLDLRLILERLAAVTILTALLAATWLAVAAPILEAFADRRQVLEDTVKLTQGFARTIANRDRLETRKAALLAETNASQDVIAGPSQAAIAAILQGQVRQLLETQGGEVSSLALGQPAGDGPVRRLAVAFDARLPSERLPDMLMALAQARPPLGLNRLDIRSPILPSTAPSSRTAPSFLQISAEIYGLVPAAVP